jgi:hypothetical protein
VRIARTIGGIARHLSRPGERAPQARLERQRGHKSFLTWAFFLAQVAALEQLRAGAARAQENELSENSAGRTTAPFDGPPAEVAPVKTGAAEAIAAAPAAGSSAALPTAPHDDMQSAFQPAPLPHTSGQATPLAGAGGSSGAAPAAHIGSSTNPDQLLPTKLLEIGADEQGTPPPVDVDTGLSPVLGFDVTIDPGGAIVGIGLDLNDLVLHPLEEVTELVDSLVTDLGNLLDNGLLGPGGLIDLSGLNLAELNLADLDLLELTGISLTDGIAGLLGSPDERSDGPAATGDTGGASGAQPVALITDTIDLLTHDILGIGGVIDFPTRALAPVNDLFAQGQHTDYGIALRDNPNAAAGQTPPPLSDTADVAGEAPASPDGPPPIDPAGALLSLVDDLLTRPTG